MIVHLRDRYGLRILVDQATFGRAGLNNLSDDDLVQLYNDLHTARECVDDGLSLEEAGLIRRHPALP
ncbi:hypothetical protein J5226_12790 [Lysobacter sp. K5869]|nr:hypothetical protein J5226_12790 [Lysobacter sp. K5869]